jgi:hypothetical protein
MEIWVDAIEDFADKIWLVELLGTAQKYVLIIFSIGVYED